jgi:sialate O-acetylesterase
VGTRLGLAALKVAYGQDVVHSGPLVDHVTFEGRRAVIQFTHRGSGLVTRDKYGYVSGFVMAGEDRVFHWAQAAIQGDTVEVFCDQVEKPVAVRYAWADNPGPLDLYNKEGLPAVPFRSDHWPGVGTGKRFDHTKPRF